MLLDSPFRSGSQVYIFCCTILLFYVLVMDVRLVMGGGTVMGKRKHLGETALQNRRPNVGLCIDPKDPEFDEIREVFQVITVYKFKTITTKSLHSNRIYCRTGRIILSPSPTK